MPNGNGSKKFYESKVFWFSVLAGVVQVAGLVGFAGFQPSDDVQSILGIVTAAGALILRFVTNKGITL